MSKGAQFYGVRFSIVDDRSAGAEPLARALAVLYIVKINPGFGSSPSFPDTHLRRSCPVEALPEVPPHTWLKTTYSYTGR
ncbi:hypothetical protein CVT26_014549 [Gymnopilus dilepis]|uniref:Uncharacterized protein n=1 Tax=Gymnopilus dilepis TaxID=231916 RepID=A0A409W333_9AGAR|nr:hypothetical protein CVT26_014549 [Gymnopilus dilepis]